MHIKGIPRQCMDLAANLGNRTRIPQQGLGRAQSQRTNDLGAKGLDLPEQERRTRGCFVRLGRPVFRRTALYHIADVDLTPLQPDCEDHLIEQLSGAAHKRPSLPVLIEAWSFTYKNQAAFRRSFPKYQLIAPGMKPAPGAAGQLTAYQGELFHGSVRAPPIGPGREIFEACIPSAQNPRPCSRQRSTAAAPDNRQVHWPSYSESIFTACKEPFDPVPYFRGDLFLCHGGQVGYGAVTFDYPDLVGVTAEPGAFLKGRLPR